MKTKLDIVRSRPKPTPIEPEPIEVAEFNPKAHLEALEDVQGSIITLFEYLNGKEDYDFQKLADQLETLNSSLKLDKEFSELKQAVEAIELKPVETVGIKDFNKLLEAVKSNKPLKFDLKPLDKALSVIYQKVSDSTVSQAPEDYQPYRRVIKAGNKLIFDDSLPRSGGGGSPNTPTGLLPFEYDTILFTNADANGNYQTGTVKKNGATLTILTLSYDVNSKLTGVTRS